MKVATTFTSVHAIATIIVTDDVIETPVRIG